MEPQIPVTPVVMSSLPTMAEDSSDGGSTETDMVGALSSEAVPLEPSAVMRPASLSSCSSTSSFCSESRRSRPYGELRRLFGETVTSLARDAAMIRHLASVRVAIDSDLSIGAGARRDVGLRLLSSDDDEEENVNPNCDPDQSGMTKSLSLPNRRRKGKAGTNTVESLRQVERKTAVLEQKVQMLKELLDEEKGFLRDLMQTQRDAYRQHLILQHMARELTSLRLTNDQCFTRNGRAAPTATSETQQSRDLVAGSRERELTTISGKGCARENHGKSVTAFSTQLHNDSDNRGLHQLSGDASRHERDHSGNDRQTNQREIAEHSTDSFSSSISASRLDHQRQHERDMRAKSISLRPVTYSEFRTVPRNIKGRITLASINDALRNIEQTVNEKYLLLSRSPTSFSFPADATKMRRKRVVVGRGVASCTVGGGGGGKGGRMQHNHHQQQTSPYAECDEHYGNLPWVSEQDLRDTCAFFRSGESSARAILTVLRRVGRLRQVRGLRSPSHFSYVCLPSSEKEPP